MTDMHQHFEETCCLYLQGRRANQK